MRISDWSSDVCSSDLRHGARRGRRRRTPRTGLPAQSGGVDAGAAARRAGSPEALNHTSVAGLHSGLRPKQPVGLDTDLLGNCSCIALPPASMQRSEEHTSELQSLMRISYAVFCLKTKNINTITYQ